MIGFALSLASLARADVRVLHLSPDAPAVDVLVGVTGESKAAVLQDVTYPMISDYLPLPTGNYDVDVVPSVGGDPVIQLVNQPIDGDTIYSVAAVNTVDMIEPLLLVDDNTINPMKARVRVVHASPNAGPVDVAVDGVGVVLPSFAFKDVSPYLELDPGAYTVRLFEPGTTNQIFEVADLPVAGGTVYSAWAIGLVGDEAAPFTVLPSVDAVPEPASAVLLGLGMMLIAGRVRRRG
jgi:hypothetical protein